MREPYRFSETWEITASPARVFEALRDLARYPAWWPQVRAVDPRDLDSAVVTIRSLLPVSLQFLTTREIEDPKGLVLRVSMAGDLDGWSQWTLEKHGGGTAARFEEAARLRTPIPAPLDRLARPVFRANHAYMMRSGLRALRAMLADRG